MGESDYACRSLKRRELILMEAVMLFNLVTAISTNLMLLSTLRACWFFLFLFFYFIFLICLFVLSLLPLLMELSAVNEGSLIPLPHKPQAAHSSAS